MQIVDFLTSQREEYIKDFETLYQKLEGEGEEAFIEPIDEAETSDRDDNTLFSFFRYDILVKKDDEYYEVKVNVNPSRFEPRVQIKQGSLDILLQSFVWNACSIGFLAETLDFKPIREWYLKWIQTDKHSMEKEITGAIHGVNILSSKNAKEITVDFGSAPVEAAMELFSILAMSNIKTVLIRSGYE